MTTSISTTGVRAGFLSRLLVRTLLFLACMTAVGAGAAGLTACKDCRFTASTVVHAAGVPASVNKLAEAIRFEGEKLASSSLAHVSSIAKTLARNPAGKEAKLRVAADAGLKGASAEAQATARAQALSDALIKAGLPADRFEAIAVER